MSVDFRDFLASMGLEADEEIQVTVEIDEHTTKITVVLGEASIVIEHSHEAISIVPWLVASLPTVLDQIISQEEE